MRGGRHGAEDRVGGFNGWTVHHGRSAGKPQSRSTAPGVCSRCPVFLLLIGGLLPTGRDGEDSAISHAVEEQGLEPCPTAVVTEERGRLAKCVLCSLAGDNKGAAGVVGRPLYAQSVHPGQARVLPIATAYARRDCTSLDVIFVDGLSSCLLSQLITAGVYGSDRAFSFSTIRVSRRTRSFALTTQFVAFCSAASERTLRLR